MQAQYNQKLCFNNQPGDKVWLKVKFYKTGENRKLARRRYGPWTVLRKLPNGVNFEISNDKTHEKKIVHHDRLSQVKANVDMDTQHSELHRRHCETDNSKDKPTIGDLGDQPSSETSDEDESDDSSSIVSGSAYDSEPETDNLEPDPFVPLRQYPQRDRRLRQFPDNIPWDAIRI